VLDPHVLDVDARLPRSLEQPGQLARAVADHHRDDCIVGRGAAPLPGNTGYPGPAALQQPGHVLDRFLVAAGDPGQRAGHGGEVGGDGGQHLGGVSGVGRQDLRPQERIRLRDPGDIAQSLAGQRKRAVRRVLEPGGHGYRDRIGRVRDQRHPAIVISRGHHGGLGTAGPGQAIGSRDSVGSGLRQRADHPRAAQEQVSPGRCGSRPLPPG
jgi:hypothetical protein